MLDHFLATSTESKNAGLTLRWPWALRLVLRDLRGGLRGFGVFLGCIALGVAAITGVGSVSLSLSDGLARQGREILGGDISFDLVQRELTAPERDFLKSSGRLSEVTRLRAMARNDKGDAALVEVKAIDAAYPLAGAAVLDPPQGLQAALAEKDGVYGLAAEAGLLAELGRVLGERVKIGEALFELRSVLVSEPDQLAGGIGFGPRVFMTKAALRSTELIAPGSLYHALGRLALGPDGAAPPSDSDVAAFHAKADAAFPEAAWRVRTRDNVSPQFSRNLDRFTQFLTLVGLTSLIVGGVGVANAIRGYVERKRQTTAILKSLGGTGLTVFTLMLTQVMLVACLGLAMGAALGTALPFIAAASFGSLIPFPFEPAIHFSAIGQGLAYGFLTALAFSIGPLGRAHDAPVQALFRDEIEPRRTRSRWGYVALALTAALGLIGAVFAFSNDRMLAAIYLAATLAAFGLLRLIGFLIMLGARKLPQARNVALRLAIANIHRPGALTHSVVLSLGLGLALLVALMLIDGNLRAELKSGLPGETPSFFFVDVQSNKAEAFIQFLKERAPGARLDLAPMLRGRILTLNGLAADPAKAKEKVAWVLEGDRGITFSESLPQGSALIKGEWWPKDYEGPPLISLENDVAEGLGLAIGDEIGVNVLGRTIVGRVANIRKVNWRSFGMNFVLVFSPNSFKGAPHGDLITLTYPGGAESGREIALLRETARAFPAVTTIRVRDALDAVGSIVGRLAVAVRAASLVALLASILVLGGALGAGQQARIHDAVVLKTLGATRARLFATYLLEYGVLGFCAALFGAAAGGAAAFAIVREVMGLDFVWLWPQALEAAAAALAVTIGLGLSGSWRILGREPAPYLRDL